MEHINYLLTKFPEHFKDHSDVSIGPGWVDLVEDLIYEVRDFLCKHNMPYKNFTFTQVKEKFGGLRAYYSMELESVDDSSNELDDELDDKLYNLIWLYERKSYTVCENCAQPGSITKDKGWVLTLCDSCKKKENRS